MKMQREFSWKGILIFLFIVDPIYRIIVFSSFYISLTTLIELGKLDLIVRIGMINSIIAMVVVYIFLFIYFVFPKIEENEHKKSIHTKRR
ncbi:hypothetical protein LCGC14_0953910 [marine sediment metagenome]|uniref:Uncharacterized protein n=1 Tax=marine sediment metagenome TaxID=412755 RepID=A0A0F9QZT4_9ZZZZ